MPLTNGKAHDETRRKQTEIVFYLFFVVTKRSESMSVTDNQVPGDGLSI